MTAEIIQIRDFQNKRDLERLRSEQTLEQQAIEIANICFPSIVCTGNDTSPSELNPTAES